jgi:hypothetical protein
VVTACGWAKHGDRISICSSPDCFVAIRPNGLSPWSDGPLGNQVSFAAAELLKTTFSANLGAGIERRDHERISVRAPVRRLDVPRASVESAGRSSRNSRPVSANSEGPQKWRGSARLLNIAARSSIESFSFGAIATELHVAPSSRVVPASIQEQPSAGFLTAFANVVNVR